MGKYPYFCSMITAKPHSMKLKFEGQEHCIDASTLVSVLTQYQSVVTEANRQLSGGARNVTLKVNAIEKGSFIIDVSVNQSLVEQLFSSESVVYASCLCTIAAGVYGLYKKFKGRPVNPGSDKEEASALLGIDGDANTVNLTINTYNVPDVRRAVSKSIEVSKEDPNVDGFTVIGDNGGKSTVFMRTEFNEYLYDGFDTEDNIPGERVEEETATLVIVGLSFEAGARWSFMYNGFKISFPVKDGQLMKRIEAGERFGKGDAIKVRLRRIQRYNKEYRAYENKSYKIVEFMEHVIPPGQQALFDD